MKATQRKAAGPLGPVGRSGKSQDDAAEHGILQDSGEWADDAAARLLLDALLRDQTGKCYEDDLTAQSIVMCGCSGAGVDDLIYLSARMRGLIFRAYARRISDLLISGGRLGGDLAGDRKLH